MWLTRALGVQESINGMRLHQPTDALPWRAAGARAHCRANEDTNTVPGHSYQRSAARPPWNLIITHSKPHVYATLGAIGSIKAIGGLAS